MLSRRNFLKLSGLGAVAVGAGFGMGKVAGMRKSEFFRVQAFLPDQPSVAELTRIIAAKMNHPVELLTVGSNKWTKVIEESYPKVSSSGDGKIIFRIEDLNKSFNGDLLISDDTKMIYNPERDFNSEMNSFRTRIKNRKSSFLFSAEYRQESILNSIFKDGSKIAVIEDENGIFDKFLLINSYNEINVKGPSGKTSIRISDGKVDVTTSCCRNGLCRLSGSISKPGELIACAPNKILVRIEEA